MKFCDNCNSLLMASKEYLVCIKCETIEKGSIEIKETISKKSFGEGIANPYENEKGYEFECKRCQNDKCDIIDIGMMIGDEDWIYVLKCTKCGWSKRIGEMC